MQGKRGAVAAEGSNKRFAYLCCVVGQEWESQELRKVTGLGVFLLIKAGPMGRALKTLEELQGMLWP